MLIGKRQLVEIQERNTECMSQLAQERRPSCHYLWSLRARERFGRPQRQRCLGVVGALRECVAKSELWRRYRLLSHREDPTRPHEHRFAYIVDSWSHSPISSPTSAFRPLSPLTTSKTISFVTCVPSANLNVTLLRITRVSMYTVPFTLTLLYQSYDNF